MNLNKTVKVRFWNKVSEVVEIKEKTLEELIENPFMYHVADVGFHLLNAAREERGLKPLTKEAVQLDLL